MASHTLPPALAASTSTSTPSCYTAVPGKNGYVPPSACNAVWAYSPSFSGAIAFSFFFGMLTIAQLFFAFRYRKGFCWVIIMGASWELISFVTRAMGAKDQQSTPLGFASTLLFLLAPLWINAFVYMTAGRMIWMFHPEKKVWRVKAVSLAKYFVWLDVFSFVVQGVGGTMLSPGSSASQQNLGKNIYMIGLGVQEGFIVMFFALVVRFQITVRRLEALGQAPPTTQTRNGRRWKALTYVVYAVLVLITIRIIFRLVEFSAGIEVSNPLPYHEYYALVLDALPMLLALLALTVLHPGMVLKGPESQFPSRKERKMAKKAAKAEKKQKKEDKRHGKSYAGGVTYETRQENNKGAGHDVEMGIVR
ncbi:hypothetical protein P154DRAFT_617506 [Amniculicola lignicola CBS 123094]|uniref:RTA1-domain-containing protein n=1 Tax=Amniculicola lignicola CBS 123094 TaxID=1392246 RepID=A0A6A5X0V8_9PLEO|nr:hypothetical protein P154DRAFT_617506 [Amniculicola lignicola CBS 123094]